MVPALGEGPSAQHPAGAPPPHVLALVRANIPPALQDFVKRRDKNLPFSPTPWLDDPDIGNLVDCNQDGNVCWHHAKKGGSVQCCLACRVPTILHKNWTCRGLDVGCIKHALPSCSD